MKPVSFNNSVYLFFQALSLWDLFINIETPLCSILSGTAKNFVLFCFSLLFHFFLKSFNSASCRSISF